MFALVCGFRCARLESRDDELRRLRMITHVLSLDMQISKSAFPQLEPSEIMLFAQWFLAASARYLPPECAVAVLAESSRAS